MNIKRYAAAALIAAMAGGILPGTFAAGDEKNYSGDIELMIGLGLMNCDEDGDFHEDDPFSRVDMASLLVNTVEYAANYGEESDGAFQKRYNPWTFYEGATDFVSDRTIAPGTVDEATYVPGEDSGEAENPESGETSEESRSSYSDVSGNADVEKVTRYGIMNGYKGKFNPDANIKTIDALASVINLMGYRSVVEHMGGYPNGYLTLAANLELDVNGLYEPITRRELANLYVDVITSASARLTWRDGSVALDNEGGESLMSKVMKLETIKGRVVKNEITSFVGASDIRADGVQIDETVLYTSEKTEYVQDMIGRSVEAYYFNDDTDRDGEIVYCRRSKTNEEIVFDLDDYIEYRDGVMRYYSNDREKSKRVSKNPFYIYNGLAVTSCPDSYFGSNQGTVTLISPDSGEYDLIIIESYESWYADKAYETKDGYEIVNKLQNNSVLSFKKDDVGTKVRIYKGNQDRAEPGDISGGTVIDISKNGDIVKIIISETVIYDFKLSGSGSDGDKTVITGNNMEYTVSEDYLNSVVYGKFIGGKLYDVYLNSFGMAAYVYSAGDSTLKIGYLMKFINDNEDEKTLAKLVTASRTAEIIPLAEKIYLSDNTGKNERMRIKSNDDYGRYLSGVAAQVIRYAVNAAGEIQTVELALDKGVASDSSDRLCVLAEASGDASDLTYHYADGSLGSKVYMTKQTPVLTIPSDVNDISRYKIVNYEALTKGERRMTAYGTNTDSPIADYVLYYDSASAVATGDTGIWLVTKVYDTVDENDEKMTAFDTYYYNYGVTNTYYLKNEDFPKGVLPFPLAIVNDGTGVTDADYCQLGKGDIVTFAADTDNNITAISLVFDADAKYDNSKYETRLSTSADFDKTFTWSETGTLAGTVGYWGKTISNTNPVMTDCKGITKVTSNTAYAAHMGATRYTLGYVYDINDNYVTYTTKNLKELGGGLPEVKYGEKFIVDTKLITRVWSWADISGKTVEAGLLSENMDKLKTYKDYRSECSRILVSGGGGHAANAVYIINGSR